MVSTTVLGNLDAQVWEMTRLAPWESERRAQAQIEGEGTTRAEGCAAEDHVQPRGECLNTRLL